MKTKMILRIYNSKGELEQEYNEEQYQEIQKIFSEYMFLKFIVKAPYRVSTKYNYDGTYQVTFKDTLNNYKFEFDGISSDSLRYI